MEMGSITPFLCHFRLLLRRPLGVTALATLGRGARIVDDTGRDLCSRIQLVAHGSILRKGVRFNHRFTCERSLTRRHYIRCGSACQV